MGTVFRIFLPRHIPGKEELAPANAPAIAALASANNLAQAAQPDLTGHGTVLLVEDEEGLRVLNARGLASRGYTVLTASNGVEALEELERNEGKVDLVVSDVVMPEMDGPTLLKEMRKTNPGLKMIFVSGYAEEAFQKNLPPGGQFAFLAKPFALKQLVETVKETLAKCNLSAGSISLSAHSRQRPRCRARLTGSGVIQKFKEKSGPRLRGDEQS